MELPGKRLIAELAVIVIGVLIALGADSWWEHRQERRRGDDYLRQLLFDFRETERDLQKAVAGDTRTLEAVNQVLDRAFRSQFPPADSLELPTGYHVFHPLTGTLTALVHGGDLRLLRGDTLRFELVKYMALVDDIERILHHAETMIWHSTERLALGRARHSQSVSRVPRATSSWRQVDVSAALNDPEVISALQVQMVASGIRLFNLGRINEPTNGIIRLIEAELHEHEREP